MNVNRLINNDEILILFLLTSFIDEINQSALNVNKEIEQHLIQLEFHKHLPTERSKESRINMNHDVKHKTYFNTLTCCEGNKPSQERNHKFQTLLKPINLITRKLTCENAIKNKQKIPCQQ